MEDTVRRDLKAWNIREEWATDRERWKDTVRRDRKAWNIREEWTGNVERYCQQGPEILEHQGGMGH